MIPEKFRIGIVNNECSCLKNNFLEPQHFSCEFINKLNNFLLTHYKSIIEAESDFKINQLDAIIEIPSNFTSSLINNNDENDPWINFIDFKDDESKFVPIVITIDNSKYPFLQFIKQKVIKIFQESLKNISQIYKVKSHLLIKPIKIKEAMYAPLSFECRTSQAVIVSIMLSILLKLNFDFFVTCALF